MRNRNIEKRFEDSYSMQERCVLMNIKETISQVKKFNRLLTKEEARENKKLIMEKLEKAEKRE